MLLVHAKIDAMANPCWWSQVPMVVNSRGSEKNQLLINHVYDIDDYDLIIKFPKID